jgi:hypothetical protein
MQTTFRCTYPLVRRPYFPLILAVISALIFGGAVTVWIRSHVVGELWRWQRSLDSSIRHGNLRIVVHFAKGTLYTSTRSSEAYDPRYIETSRRWNAQYGFEALRHETGVKARPLSYARATNEGRSYSWLGFEHHRWQDTPPPYGSKVTITAVPLWLPTAVSGLTTGAFLRVWWTRRRRQKNGLCTRCGYDLRASPSRCPECGYGAGPAGAEAALAPPAVCPAQ